MESTFYTVDGKEFELKHHGIKGMKWGIRRTPKQLGHDPSGNADPKNLNAKKRFQKESKRDAKDIISKYIEIQKQSDEAYKKYEKNPSPETWKAYVSSADEVVKATHAIREPYYGKYDAVRIGGGSSGGRYYTTVQLEKYDENGRVMVYRSPKVYY